MTSTQTTSIADLWQLLETVSDPEVPVLSVVDLGVVRAIELAEGGGVKITITPTYSGCPAMNVIEINIRAVLQEHGYAPVTVETVLSPAWTTDWLSEAGREKLRAYGIAPPEPGDEEADALALFRPEKKVSCPHCNSRNTRLVSQFGSTACKALYRCLDCLEPFDYFKCH